jgi:hypothetical protein
MMYRLAALLICMAGMGCSHEIKYPRILKNPCTGKYAIQMNAEDWVGEQYINGIFWVGPGVHPDVDTIEYKDLGEELAFSDSSSAVTWLNAYQIKKAKERVKSDHLQKLRDSAWKCQHSYN